MSFIADLKATLTAAKADFDSETDPTERTIARVVAFIFGVIVVLVAFGVLLLLWEIAKALFPIAVAFVVVYAVLVYFDKAPMPKFAKKLLRK